MANVSFVHKGNEDNTDGEWPYYNFIKLTTVFFFIATAFLTLEDIREVLDLTFPHCAKWRQIGVQLGIDVGKLDAIEANRKMVEDCLTDLISHWLRNAIPKPTRGALTTLLQSQYFTSGKLVHCVHVATIIVTVSHDTMYVHKLHCKIRILCSS